MAALSKLHDKCNKCVHKNKCDYKRMVACAMAGLPQSSIENMAMPSAALLSAPAIKNETLVTVNIGSREIADTVLEKICERLKNDIGKQIYCEFNKA